MYFFNNKNPIIYKTKTSIKTHKNINDKKYNFT